LQGWQKWASKKATDTYAKRKEYLDRDDLFSLRDFDTSGIEMTSILCF